MITPDIIDELLLEWSYRLKDGIPDINDPEKVKILNQILTENKIVLFEAGRDTELLSEGLFIYFCCLDESKFDAAEDFIFGNAKNKTMSAKYKLPLTGIDSEYYGADAASSVSKIIGQFNKNLIDHKLFANAISSANVVRKIYKGAVPAGSIDRGTLYTLIRQKATKLAKEAGLTGIVDDKWCPADVFIYGPGITSAVIGSINMLNVESDKSKSINGLFSNMFEKPKSKQILGVSLKQEIARGGKAKSFKSILTRETTYPDAGKLDKTYEFLLELSVFLNAATDIKNDKARTKKKCLVALKVIQKFTGVIEKLDPKIKKRLLLVIPKLKSSKITRGDVNKLYDAILEGAKDQYTTSRNSFLKSLDSKKYIVSQTKVANITDIETYLKKAACYLVATDLIVGFDGKLFKLPSAVKSISVETNPFVALTAYAIGYSGISPTFYKLLGSEHSPAGKFERFTGDGVLTLPDESKIIIQDNPGYKGFVAVFNTTVMQGDKQSHSYKIELAFKFSEIEITVEVTDIEDL